MKILKRYKRVFYFIVLCINFGAYAASTPIEMEYSSTVDAYNLAIYKQDYIQACSTADNLLSMDPADTLSLLRLTYCSKMLNNKYKKLIESYLHSVSRSTTQKIEILSFIEAINATPRAEVTLSLSADVQD